MIGLHTVADMVEQQVRAVWASGRRPVKVRLGDGLRDRVHRDMAARFPGSFGAQVTHLAGLEIEWAEGSGVRVLAEDDLPSIWDDDEDPHV